MPIRESIDAIPDEITWRHDPFQISARFEMNGSIFEVEFYKGSPDALYRDDVWNVVFYNKTLFDNQKVDMYSKTGLEGTSALKLFGYIREVFSEFIDLENPDAMEFAASTYDSRDVVYEKILLRLRKWIENKGYNFVDPNVITPKKNATHKRFLILRKDHNLEDFIDVERLQASKREPITESRLRTWIDLISKSLLS